MGKKKLYTFCYVCIDNICINVLIAQIDVLSSNTYHVCDSGSQRKDPERPRLEATQTELVVTKIHYLCADAIRWVAVLNPREKRGI